MMMMTVQNLLEIGKQRLSVFTEGDLEARILLEHVLNCDHHYILSHGDTLVKKQDVVTYESYLEARMTHKPISQIMGEREFYGLRFEVNGHTLIPRPETEVLVDYVITAIGNKEALICDVGTGSGCIPVTICHECAHVKALALDISKDALDVAKRNISNYNMIERIACVESDLFSALDETYFNTVDVMISNPPYIPSIDVDALELQVRGFEPRSALDGGLDGLDFYRRISKDAIPYLSEGAMIIYEVGHDQSHAVCKILADNDYKDIDVIQDLSGINRIVLGIKRKAKQ